MKAQLKVRTKINAGYCYQCYDADSAGNVTNRYIDCAQGGDHSYSRKECGDQGGGWAQASRKCCW